MTQDLGNKKAPPLLLTNPSPLILDASKLVDQTIIPAIVIDVFAIQDSTNFAIQQAKKDRRTNKVRWRSYDGGISGALEHYKSIPSPSLILLESEAETKDLLAQLERLSEFCNPETRVIVITPRNDVALYRALLERGVTDELVSPLRSEAIVQAIARAWKDEAETKIGLMTAFIGSRGGVGSSTIAHNVAVAMAKFLETDVLLADLDLQFGTVGIDFDVDGSYGMNEVLKSADRLDDVLLNRLALKFDQNLSILAAETNLDRTADIHRGAIEKLTEVTHTSPKHVILDIPRVWTRRTKQALIAADNIVLTATPDLTSLRNCKMVIEFLRQSRPNDALPLLVMNQVGQPKRPEISAEEFAETVRVDLGPIIPFNASLFGRAANNGQLIADFAEKSSTTQTFLEIAKIINGYRVPKTRKLSTQRFLKFIKRWW